MINALANLTSLPAQLSLNPVVINIPAADPAQYPDRAALRYYCDIRVPESFLSASFKSLVLLEAAEEPAIPAGAGKLYQGAFFEIQNQLDPLLNRQAPQFGQTRISVANELTTPFYLVLSIEADDEEIFTETRPVEVLIKAGINEVDYAAYKDQLFTEFIGPNRQFLTWAPNPKTIQANQPEFLYFFTNFSPAPDRLKVRYQVRYADSTQEDGSAAELDNVLPAMVYCVPVGPKALGFDQLEKEVLSYKVWLVDQADQRVSEVREYTMDQDYRRNVRFVLFANSLGGFDTIALVGKGEESFKVSRSSSERFGGWQFLPSYAERIVNTVTGQREIQVATGWLDKKAVRYLEGLLLSKEVYLATDRAFVPLLLGTDSIQPSIDDEDLIGRTLTFQYANKETNFSALPDPAGLPKRKTGWRPKASACLLDANGRRTGKRQPTVLEAYYLDDGRKVVGVPLKANVPGTEGYIPPIPSDDCTVTPFLNTALSKPGSFLKTGCTAPLMGGPATILIPAGTYGSEISQADAQAKAEAAWLRLDTQAFANQYGTCILEPEKYSYTVPANHWHFRAADPAGVALTWTNFQDGDNRPVIGNTWMVQGSPSPYAYGMYTNDLNFPISYGSDRWRLMVYGTPGSLRRVKIYQNGILKLNYTVTLNRDGFELLFFTSNNGANFTLAAGDKIYLVNQPA